MLLSAGKKPDNAITMKPRNNRKNGGASTSAEPSRDEIASRAYQIYVRKGQPEGHDLENWLEAETELKRERNGSAQHQVETHLS